MLKNNNKTRIDIYFLNPALTKPKTTPIESLYYYLSNSNFNFNSGFDRDGGDLLDNLRGRVQVNQTLVDSHLILVKGFGTVTTRRLTGGDTKDLGGETNGTLNLELLILGTLDKIRRNYYKVLSFIFLSQRLDDFTLLQVLDITRSQGNTDTVDLGLILFLKTGLFRRALSL
jgi:hypothetical protein